jgi:DNA polymerase-3 subunit beta
MISFEGGGRRLTARLIGAEFIRYAARFPASFDVSADLPAGLFTEAVRRVSLVAERATPVQLSFRRDAVVIEARSDGRARALESVPVTFTGPDQAISFNPHYLLDGLAAAALTGQGRPHPGGESEQPPVAGTGRIRLDFTSPAKPALITWIDGDAPAGAGGPAEVRSRSADGNDGPHDAPQSSAPDGKGDSPDGAAAFRYLVVPLRTPVTGG